MRIRTSKAFLRRVARTTLSDTAAIREIFDSESRRRGKARAGKYYRVAK